METVFTKNMTEYHIDSSSESGPIQVGCAADFVVGPRSIHFVVPFEIIRLGACFCDLASESNDRVHLLHRASPDHFLMGNKPPDETLSHSSHRYRPPNPTLMGNKPLMTLHLTQAIDTDHQIPP